LLFANQALTEILYLKDFNMLKQNLLYRLLALPLAIMFLLPGCTGVKAPTVSEPEQPFAKEEAKAALYESWIAQMDPYVSQAKDGQYVFDEVGFNATHTLIAGTDLAAVQELTQGIPIVNAQMLQEAKNPGSTALGQACWYFWWGHKCCYWGANAQRAIGWLRYFGTLPAIGFVGKFWEQVANNIYLAHGGFCTNMNWLGTCWMSTP
jgi:hypothetical protein